MTLLFLFNQWIYVVPSTTSVSNLVCPAIPGRPHLMDDPASRLQCWRMHWIYFILLWFYLPSSFCRVIMCQGKSCVSVGIQSLNTKMSSVYCAILSRLNINACPIVQDNKKYVFALLVWSEKVCPCGIQFTNNTILFHSI